jgi:hypothetical protein
VEAYDEDAKLSVDLLLELPTCNGRIGATGTYQISLPTLSGYISVNECPNVPQACV